MLWSLCSIAENAHHLYHILYITNFFFISDLPCQNISLIIVTWWRFQKHTYHQRTPNYFPNQVANPRAPTSSYRNLWYPYLQEYNKKRKALKGRIENVSMARSLVLG